MRINIIFLLVLIFSQKAYAQLNPIFAERSYLFTSTFLYSSQAAIEKERHNFKKSRKLLQIGQILSSSGNSSVSNLEELKNNYRQSAWRLKSLAYRLESSVSAREIAILRLKTPEPDNLNELVNKLLKSRTWSDCQAAYLEFYAKREDYSHRLNEYNRDLRIRKQMKYSRLILKWQSVVDEAVNLNTFRKQASLCYKDLKVKPLNLETGPILSLEDINKPAFPTKPQTTKDH